jgi:hypothetical protein
MTRVGALTEETHDTATARAAASSSILVSLGAGIVLLLGMTYALRDPSAASCTSTRPWRGTAAPCQIWTDAIRLTGAKLLLLIAIGAQLFCGMSSITANSRMIYAFSGMARCRAPADLAPESISGPGRRQTRSGSVPLARLIPRPAIPVEQCRVRGVTSIAVIGLYIAYVMPTFLRLRRGDSFERGPWHPRQVELLVGWTAVIWVGCIRSCSCSRSSGR